jgi:excisionase family DNA binding protein
MTKRYVRVSDVALYTGIKLPTVRAYVLNKQIPFIKCNGVILFDLDEIDIWLSRGRVVPTAQYDDPGKETTHAN